MITHVKLKIILHIYAILYIIILRDNFSIYVIFVCGWRTIYNYAIVFLFFGWVWKIENIILLISTLPSQTFGHLWIIAPFDWCITDQDTFYIALFLRQIGNILYYLYIIILRDNFRLKQIGAKVRGHLVIWSFGHYRSGVRGQVTCHTYIHTHTYINTYCLYISFFFSILPEISTVVIYLIMSQS